MRGLLAASPELGGGTLLFGARLRAERRPWVLEENFRKTNGSCATRARATHGRLRCHRAGLRRRLAFDRPDSAARGAVRRSSIASASSIRPTAASRIATACRRRLAARVGGGAAARRWPTRSTTSSICSRTSPTSLDPENGDQFEQFDDRRVYGGDGVLARPFELAGLDARARCRRRSCGATTSTRSACIARVARERIRHDARRRRRADAATRRYVERRRRAGASACARRSGCAPTTSTSTSTASLAANSGSASDSIVSPEILAGARAVERDRVLRQRRQRLPQQRCARHDDPRRSDRRRDAGRSRRSAGRCARRRSRRAHGDPAEHAAQRRRCGRWSSIRSCCSSAMPASPSRAARASGAASSSARSGIRCQWLIVDADLAWSRARFDGRRSGGRSHSGRGGERRVGRARDRSSERLVRRRALAPLRRGAADRRRQRRVRSDDARQPRSRLSLHGER